jgi:hypothetical protein
MSENTNPISQNFILPPTLRDLLDKFKGEIFRSINCMVVGKINSFNQAMATATINVMLKKTAPAEIQSYPLLVDVPVFTLQGGGASLQMPINTGDTCLVFFADSNIDNWFATGSINNPLDARAHDISDGFAIVGVNSLAGLLTAYNANINLTVPSGCIFNVTGAGTANIFGTAALALLSEISALITTYNSHSHTGNGDQPTQQAAAAVGTVKLKAS